MKELVNLVQHVSGAGSRLGLCCLILAVEDRLQQFQIPIAEEAPDETVSGASRIVEAVVGDAFGDRPRGARQFRQYPAVDGETRILGLERRIALDAVHLRKAGCIPKLGAEITVTGDPRRIELNVTPLGRPDR